MVKEKEALQEVADCGVCLVCQKVASHALKAEPTKEELLKALRDMVDSYDDTGCEGCGVVDRDVYKRAYKIAYGD